MNGPGVRDCKRVHAINVGVGRDVTIAKLASLVAGVVGFKGQIGFDTSRPVAPRASYPKSAGWPRSAWQTRTRLAEGIASTYQWLDNELTHDSGPRGFSGREQAA